MLHPFIGFGVKLGHDSVYTSIRDCVPYCGAQVSGEGIKVGGCD